MFQDRQIRLESFFFSYQMMISGGLDSLGLCVHTGAVTVSVSLCPIG